MSSNVPGVGHDGGVAILFWLLPAVVVTCVASAWVAYVGRAEMHRGHPGERSEEAQARARQRMAEALAKPAVGAPPRASERRERSTGVAIRRP